MDQPVHAKLSNLVHIQLMLVEHIISFILLA